MRSGRAFLFLGPLLGGLGSMLADGASAAEWDSNTSVAPSLLYTDNVCLSDSNKRNGWVGVGLLTPSGSVTAKGSRSSLAAGGSVQFNTLTDGQLRDDECAGGFDSDRKQYVPNLYANGSATLIDKWLNIDTKARAAQNEVTPYLGRGGDSLNRNGNTNTYYLYSISPVVSRRVNGDMAKFNMRYTYDEVLNSSSAVSDSTSDLLNVNLVNGRSQQISWNLKGNYREVSYSDNDLTNDLGLPERENTVLRSAGLTLGYQFDRRWQVNGTYGREWNDIQTFNNANTSGNDWDIGVRWTPSSRTRVSIGSGDRFFGSTPRLDISHTRKRSVFTASYNKVITFGRDISTLQGLYDPNYIYNSTLNQQTAILDERFSLGYSYAGRNATISVNGSSSEQTRADNGQKSKFQGLAVTYSPLVSSTYTLSSTLAWNNDDPRQEFGVDPNTEFDNSSDTWIANMALGRVINERTNVSLDYQYTDQQSDQAFGSYQENRVILTLTISL